MSGNPDEAPAYCALCDRPMYGVGGRHCDACLEAADQDNDDMEEMTPKERADFAMMNIENGNLLTAIDCIMRDGDVRVDSVVAALELTALLVEHQVRPTHAVTDMLIRLIERWETAL